MSEIVKLPRYLAESITQVRNEYKSGLEYDLDFLKRENRASTNDIYNYTQQSREHLTRYFQSLVNGYEVEETPEEKVKALLKKYNTGADMHYGYRLGVRECLEALNISIEGVSE